MGRTSLGDYHVLSEFERWLMGYYLSAYSVTSALVAVSVVNLLALYSAGKTTIWRIPRRLFCRMAAGCGLLLVIINYVHAAPALLARRADGHWDRYCVELVAYMDVPNSCGIRPESAGMFEQTGLRKVRHDVVFDATVRDFGRIEKVKRFTDPTSSGARVAVTGWTALPDDASGTVLLVFGSRSRFFAQATRLTPNGKGSAWTAIVPASLFDSGVGLAYAWAYDKMAGRFVELAGAVPHR